ncbi:MAG: arylsulfatase [Rubripirellula sp.]
MIHHRFTYLQLVWIVLCVFVVDRQQATLAQTAQQSSVPRDVERPDILVIMSDDMGYSDLGCFGGEIRTPNLDRMAAEGLRFNNFYSENMCWVSRAAMLTGVYHRTSMVDNGLHPRCQTLAETLKGAGYQTLMSGKWHLAGRPYQVYPNDRGFDKFYGILGGAASFFAPAMLCRNRVNVEHEAQNDTDYYITDAISDEASAMIQDAATDEPLFLYVAYTAAHWPLHARESDIQEYEGRYAGGWDSLRVERLKRMKSLGIVPRDSELSPRNENVPKWESELHQEWQQRRMEVYAAQVTVMDRGIGRILDALQQTGRLENTLVFFTIDNGGCHVEYGADRKGDYLPSATRDGRPMRPGNLPTIMPGPEDTYQSYGHGWANASNTPYRMFKQFDHEGGIRTPMIAYWPQGIKTPGKINSAVSHLIDIVPTVASVTGVELPRNGTDEDAIELDGRSLAAAFTGGSVADHETLFFQHAKGKALRHEGWKLVSMNKKQWELYDLRSDPLELVDLAGQQPEKLEELIQLWTSESERHARQAKLR